MWHCELFVGCGDGNGRVAEGESWGGEEDRGREGDDGWFLGVCGGVCYDLGLNAMKIWKWTA